MEKLERKLYAGMAGFAEKLGLGSPAWSSEKEIKPVRYEE